MAELAAAQITDTTLSVLSWRHHDVLRRTLRSFRAKKVLELFPHRRIYFNELGAIDRTIAQDYGFEAIGSEANVGIFGGARALAAACATEFMLFVENDCPAIVGGDIFYDCLQRATADMRAHDIPVFSLRSRRRPGDKFDRRQRYEKYYQLEQPLTADDSAAHPPRRPTNPLQRVFEDLRRPSLRGCALFAEEQPHLRHPSCIRLSENGNWLTTSRVHNWSNNCLLVKADFMRDVIIPRVEAHPAPSTLNGHQDIEAAVKLDGWWQNLDIAMGQAEPGPLTHARG